MKLLNVAFDYAKASVRWAVVGVNKIVSFNKKSN
jgi:hypothetical protein